MKAYLYTFSSDDWSEMAPMSRGRYGHSCGLVQDPASNEKDVVVVGGTAVDGSLTDEVEIYRVVRLNGAFFYLHLASGRKAFKKVSTDWYD